MYYGLESLINSKDFGTYEVTTGIHPHELNIFEVVFSEIGVFINGEALFDEEIHNIMLWEEENPSLYKKVA